MGDRFRDVRPKWVNPCGGILDDSGVDPDAPPLEDSEIAANAVLDVDIALSQIESFKDEFVSCSRKGCCCNNHFSFLFLKKFRMSLTYYSLLTASGLATVFSLRIIRSNQIPSQCHTIFAGWKEKGLKRCHETKQ